MNANCCLDSKKSVEVSFVDVKSVKFRDILRKVLEGVTYINLREDKLEISCGYNGTL